MKSSEKFKGELPFAGAAETNKQNKSQNQVNEYILQAHYGVRV